VRRLLVGAEAPNRGSNRVSGVIELRVAGDFKMNLFMEDLEQHLVPHLDEHVQPEPGTGVRCGSSRSTLESASRHFPLSQPPPSTSVCCVPPGVTVLQFSRTHWPTEAAGMFFWPPGAGHRSARRESGEIGACAGCWWVQRRETGCSQLHLADGRQERQEGQEGAQEGQGRRSAGAKGDVRVLATRRD